MEKEVQYENIINQINELSLPKKVGECNTCCLKV